MRIKCKDVYVIRITELQVFNILHGVHAQYMGYTPAKRDMKPIYFPSALSEAKEVLRGKPRHFGRLHEGAGHKDGNDMCTFLWAQK